MRWGLFLSHAALCCAITSKLSELFSTFSSVLLNLFKGVAFSITFFAKAIAPLLSSSTISSMAPIANAFSAFTGLPVVIISIALLTPTNLGVLCVPAEPGSKPKCTSGSPTDASFVAILKWVDKAISKAPPRAKPCIAAITGFSLCSIRSHTSGRCGSSAGR